jgi:sulfofructose kinase
VSDVTPTAVGLGCLTLDILIRVETLPTWEKGSGFEAIGFDGGGPAATGIAAVSRLGVPAGSIGTAGNDDAAELKLSLSTRCGVDVSKVVRRDEPDDSVVVVFVHAKTGERMFFGGGRQGHRPIRIEELDRDYLTSADYLLLDGLHFDAAIQAAEWMHEAGKTVVYDAGKPHGGEVRENRRTLTSHVDVLISGAGFAQAFSGIDDIGKAGEAVLDAGPRVFVQTEGDGGCHTVTADDQFHTPSFEVDVVDTTGAGDVFHGAYIVALSRGWDVRRAAMFSSAVSALKCTKLGGRAGIPTFDETIEFLRVKRGHITF